MRDEEQINHGYLIGFRGWNTTGNGLTAVSSRDDDYWNPANMGRPARCRSSVICSTEMAGWTVNEETMMVDINHFVSTDLDTDVYEFALNVGASRCTTRIDNAAMDGLRGVVDDAVWAFLAKCPHRKLTLNTLPPVFLTILKFAIEEAKRRGAVANIPPRAIPPTLKCQCGIHAWYDLDKAHGFGQVWGAVKCWGKMVEHPPDGVRCQHAEVIAIADMGNPRDEKVMASLYRVPIVSTAPINHKGEQIPRIMLWAREFGDVRPAGNLQRSVPDSDSP